MNQQRYAFTLCAILVFAWTLQGGAQRSESQSAEPAWSSAVQGVRGRLFAIPEGNSLQPQVRIEIELQNATDAITPIPIWWSNWNAMLAFGLEEESGKLVVSDIAPGGNQAVIPPFWLELLPRSTMRATITTALFQYLPPPPSERLLLRPTVFQGWMFKPGPTWTPYLKATLTPPKSPEKRRPQFTGPLVLPRVALPAIAYH